MSQVLSTHYMTCDKEGGTVAPFELELSSRMSA